MATTWNLYAEAGLTAPASGAVVLSSTGTHTDLLMFFGSPSAGKTLRAASAPGAAPITITPADASPGSGIEASAVKLALSSAGLASATGGAALTVGTTLNSGTAGAVAVYVRVMRGSLGVGSYSGLSLTTNALVEA